MYATEIFLCSIDYLLFAFAFTSQAQAQSKLTNQRVIVIMIDGFGEKYYCQASMLFLNQMEKDGIYKVMPSIMPAVTNVNSHGHLACR
jgi:phosphonoacetate hydrolase